jgi:hypothetical protein
MPSVEHASCAIIPVAALSTLAGIRANPEVQVQILGDRAWLRWPAHAGEVLRLLLPVPGAVFYVRQEGQWYSPDSRLPTSAVPDLTDPSQLHRVLIPEPVQPILPRSQSDLPVEVTLRRSDRPRPCAALWCRLAELASWANTATAAEISEVFAARSGEDVLLRGNRLPASPRGQRFWGRELLVPLGYRPVPDLIERDLGVALGVGEDEYAILLPAKGTENEEGPAVLELLPADAFEPLTRAAIRLALQEFACP